MTTRVPEDFHTITPHLVVRGVARAIAWYTSALGGTSCSATPPQAAKCDHALELLLGDSRFFVVDEFPGHAWSPESLGASSVTLHLYVEDVDALFARAVAAGAHVLLPVGDQFWGDRYACSRDPFGHRWSIASRIEDLSPRAMKSRVTSWANDHPSGEQLP